MENGKTRVLAYRLATTINDNDLDNVSGGQAQISSRQTLHVSGNSAQGPDVFYDVSADM